MKIITVLFALFLALTCQTGFSQKQLSNGIKPYVTTWPMSLIHTLDRTGFSFSKVLLPTLSTILSPNAGHEQAGGSTSYSTNRLAAKPAVPNPRSAKEPVEKPQYSTGMVQWSLPVEVQVWNTVRQLLQSWWLQPNQLFTLQY